MSRDEALGLSEVEDKFSVLFTSHPERNTTESSE